jgi:peptidoglycan/xylan/chitin deacetylase (PgdA/CDA1 family)
VPPSLFAEQLAAVAERGAAFARVSDVPALLAGTAPLRPTAVISIDDAYADVLNIVDTLGAHRAPATLFVPTQFVGRTAGWMSEAAERLPVLGWRELGELQGAGIELGSHGHAHIAADVNSPQLVLEDARRSLAAFEEQLAIRPTSYAYPFGFEDRAARRAIRAAGFGQACAIRHVQAQPRDDPFALPRLYVGPDTDAEMLARLVTTPRPVLVEHALRTVSRMRIAVRAVAPQRRDGAGRVTGRGADERPSAPLPRAEAVGGGDEDSGEPS